MKTDAYHTDEIIDMSEATETKSVMLLTEAKDGKTDQNTCMAMETEIKSDYWEPLPEPIIIDSGASVSVIPRKWCMGYPVKNTVKKGTKYKVANGDTVENEGECTLTLGTYDGQVKNLRFQVAEVSKALCSAGAIVQAGHRVVLDGDGSYIELKSTHNRLGLRLDNGVFVLDAAVAPLDWAEQQGFTRQGC